MNVDHAHSARSQNQQQFAIPGDLRRKRGSTLGQGFVQFVAIRQWVPNSHAPDAVHLDDVKQTASERATRLMLINRQPPLANLSAGCGFVNREHRLIGTKHKQRFAIAEQAGLAFAEQS